MEENYSPKRYDTDGLECIDVMEKIKGWFKTYVFCEMNDFKYNWRLGKKETSPIHKDLEKMNWYSTIALKLWNQAMHWYFPNNKHTYAVIGEVKLKNPSNGEWKDAYLYTDGSSMYVREKEDFLNKFKNLNVPKVN